MEVLEAIKTRRSIRHYKPDAISEEKLNTVLEAAHALGLGTVHVGRFDAQKAAQILNVPQDVVVVEMTPLGYPAKEAKTPPRKELPELVFRESYR